MFIAQGVSQFAGQVVAIEFAKRGAKVVVSGRREREGDEVVGGIKGRLVRTTRGS
jgi:NAD(P)-dependent dehydrogenase (short-subunit alcohol dehydrogenase family)